MAEVRSPASAESGRAPAHRRRARAVFDHFESFVASSRLPARSALGWASAIGSLRGALSGRWPAPDEVEALFGTPRIASRRIAIGIAAREAKNRLVLRRTGNRSLSPFAPLVRWRDPSSVAALRPPAVLLTAHVGALHLLAAGLDRIAVRRTVLRWSSQHLTGPDESNAPLSGGVMARADALRRALDELREGGFASSALDGDSGAATRGRLLGRPLRIGTGGFALARLIDAPVIPVAALWERGGVVCELGAPVDDALAATRWFEELLRSSPAQIGLGLLRRLLFGPAVDLPEEHAARR